MSSSLVDSAKKYRFEDKQYVLEYSKKQGPYNMKAFHVHNAYEIYYLFSGKRKYFIRDRVYLVEKGDLVFIPKYDLHRTLFAGTLQHQRIVMYFNDAFLEHSWVAGSNLNLLQPFQNEHHTLRLREDDRLFLESLFYRSIAEMKDRPSGYEINLKVLAIEILIHISRCLEKQTESITPIDSPLHQKVSEIAAYMNNHFKEPLTLAYLSERFYISTYYLSRAFKEITGFSFVEYLNYVRMKQAQRLLRETKWKVQRIAEEVGFESIAHFGRVFKQTVLVSPLQYRRLEQGKSDGIRTEAIDGIKIQEE